MVDTKFKKGLMPWNKGKKTGKPSWNRGIPHSEEHIRKLKESHVGMEGKKHSEETRRKMSESSKGKHHSIETRKKLSEYNKGKTPWNKGKFGIYSEEARRKMSEAHKKLMSNLEARKRVSEFFKGKTSWMKGKKHTTESILKMSLAHKGRPTWNKGIPMREESRDKSSKSHKGLHISPKTEFKKGLIPWISGKHHTEEAKEKMSKAIKKGLSNLEVRRRLSEAHKGRPTWNKGKKLPETSEPSRQRMLKLYESGGFPKQTNTKPERQIKEELLKRGYKEGIDFIHQYKFMNKFMCDFCFPQQKVIVEVNGDFWHGNPKKYSDQAKLHPHQIKGIGRDKSKKAYITTVDNRSWIFLSFWESEIKEDVTKCGDKIEEVLRTKLDK